MTRSHDWITARCTRLHAVGDQGVYRARTLRLLNSVAVGYLRWDGLDLAQTHSGFARAGEILDRCVSDAERAGKRITWQLQLIMLLNLNSARELQARVAPDAASQKVAATAAMTALRRLERFGPDIDVEALGEHGALMLIDD